MLLFFDGVAVLVDSQARDLLVAGQEETVLPLVDSGHLHVLDPDVLIDEQTSTALIDFILQIATSEEKESIYSGKSLSDRGLLFPSLFGPRALNTQERAAAIMVWQEMQRRGFASDFHPGDEILVDADKWQLILAFLAHALRPAGIRAGLDLQPATDDPKIVYSLVRTLDLPGFPASGHVVTFDLEQVALDLSDVPIYDVLDFREHHGDRYRAYVASLRRFAMEIGALPVAERQAGFISRRDELADEADRLKRIARTWWRRPIASVGVGVAGAIWSATRGDWPASVISLLGGIAGAGGKPEMASAYSYLFKAQSRFGTR
jgi:hypothetical protein